jgi:adenylylsulfate kinase-like enzyme
MKKKILINKKKGTVYWITGLSGVGKTTISLKLLDLLKKKNNNTILINGDDLRKIFELNKYDKEARIKYAKQYSKLCQFLSNQGINVILTIVGLFRDIHKWNRNNITNYIEVYIKSDINLIKVHDKRKIYKKKKVFGKDIKPEIPKKPDIIITNDFFKGQKFYAKKIFKKINDL